MDPFGAISELIIGLRGASQLQRWMRLLFSMSASYLLAASTATGTALVSGVSVPVAVGLGLISGSAMALVAYLRADPKIIEGTVIVVPQKTVTDSVTDSGQGPTVIRP